MALIAKQTDEKSNLDKFQYCGYEAEKQMGFYLKRAFQKDNEIIVINDMRLEMGKDIAQIDHLVIHKYGFIVIESKSVTSEVSINEHGEWIRHFAGQTKGIPSPVNQAKRQTDFLKDFLLVRGRDLFRKKKIFKATFSDFKYDVLVAISDDGIVNRAQGITFDEVYKADQITDAVKNIINGYEETNNKILSVKTNWSFMDATIQKISSYLIRSHKPVGGNTEAQIIVSKKKVDNDEIASPSVAIAKSSDQPKYCCSKCSSNNIEITYGRYGYYFKCKDCDGNTAIKLTCNKSTCKPKIRKKKSEFYKECDECGTSELYFENSE